MTYEELVWELDRVNTCIGEYNRIKTELLKKAQKKV